MGAIRIKRGKQELIASACALKAVGSPSFQRTASPLLLDVGVVHALPQMPAAVHLAHHLHADSLQHVCVCVRACACVCVRVCVHASTHVRQDESGTGHPGEESGKSGRACHEDSVAFEEMQSPLLVATRPPQ